jgi:hypothetical protein
MIHPDQYHDLFFPPAGAGRTRAIRTFLPAAAWTEILGDARPTRRMSRIRPPEHERGTAADAAAILGLKPRKLQAMAARSEIPGAAKLGRQWTFDLAELRRFVEQREQETKCRGSEKRRPAATGATGFSMPSFKSGGDKSGGRLGQMIQQLQRRVDKQSKSGR